MSIQKTLADRVEKERAEKEAEAAAAQVDGEAAVEPVEAMAPWAKATLRLQALELAVEIHVGLGGGDDEDVVATAEAFLAFLTGGAK